MLNERRIARDAGHVQSSTIRRRPGHADVQVFVWCVRDRGRMPHIEVDGRRIFYVRRGTGEPLLLIHGMGGHHLSWGERFLGPLARDSDVVTFDHRGIGRSDRADEPFTVADLADDAAGLLAGIGWPAAHVFGVAVGGMVAQELALRHPELVRTMTIGASSAGGRDGEVPATVHRMMDAIATRNVDHGLRTTFEATLSPRFTADPANFDTYRRLTLAERAPVPVVQRQYRAGRAHDTTTRLSAVTAATLVLHGTADAIIAPANGKRVARLIPGARLELLDGAGHLFWWEQPDRTVTLLRDHITGGHP
jgi:pimeloyl-ACP methyl ester carboxylesterase